MISVNLYFECAPCKIYLDKRIAKITDITGHIKLHCDLEKRINIVQCQYLRLRRQTIIISPYYRLSSFQAFAKEGAKVIATDINEAKLKELEAESPSGCLALI